MSWLSNPPSDSVHEERICLELDYPVVFEREILHPHSQALLWAIARREPEKVHRVFVVADSGFLDVQPEFEEKLYQYFSSHEKHLILVASVFRLPGGEAAKTDPKIIEELHGRLLAAKMDRHSVVLACGGGAVLDAAGYAAAIFHRGLRLVRVPTTVLGQNDAGIGVKNGVNALGVKNLLGTFAPPFAVLNDATLLRSLGARDVRSGLAEAVKVALIRDADFFFWLCSQVGPLGAREEDALQRAVRWAALLHLQHISEGGDPFETGSARPLDFGHWSAHRLEIQSGHALRHGEAVAVGMAIDVVYSKMVGLLPQDRADAIVRLLLDLGFDLSPACLLSRTQGALDVLKGLREFQEHIGGQLTITLLADIGRGIDVHEIDEDKMSEAILFVGKLGDSKAMSR